MNKHPLEILRRFTQTVFFSARIEAGRSKADLLADRIRQAATCQSLTQFGERLCALMQVEVATLADDAIVPYIGLCGAPEAAAVLAWVRTNGTLLAALTASKRTDADAVISTLEIPTVAEADAAISRPDFHIGLRAKLLAPLGHGSDSKAGNATLFRRMAVLGVKGTTLQLPYYAGNAVRGQLRDLLADHFTRALGLEARRDRPVWALWFFHAMYAGGALEEAGQQKKLDAALGANGALRTEGIRELRDTLPMLNLLGAAMGNRIISGHAQFGDLRPLCREWGNGGTQSAEELLCWLYLTRREDHEEHKEHHGMIATTECLRAGAEMEGGIDVALHTSELSRSALGLGLRLLAERGYLGAQNRQGYGRCEITVTGAPDATLYETYLAERQREIREYLKSIGALSPDVLF